jgi:hypothetical protein
MTPYSAAVVVNLGTMGQYGLRQNLPPAIANPLPAGQLNTILRLGDEGERSNVAIVMGHRDDQGAASLTSMFDLRCSRDVPPRMGKQSVIICLAQAMPTVRGQPSLRARRLAGSLWRLQLEGMEGREAEWVGTICATDERVIWTRKPRRKGSRSVLC